MSLQQEPPGVLKRQLGVSNMKVDDDENIEEEVYRLSVFDTNKCYVTGLYDRKVGRYPAEKYYIKKSGLRYVGRYVKAISNGYGDNRTVTYYFDNNGIENTVTLDYDGKTCFKDVECISNATGGKRYRKNKKTKKQKTKNKKTKKQKEEEPENIKPNSNKTNLFIFLPNYPQENKR